MTKTQLKEQAQDHLLQGMANALLAHREGVYGEPDEEMIAEMEKQAKRAMKFFGVDFFPGLGSVN